MPVESDGQKAAQTRCFAIVNKSGRKLRNLYDLILFGFAFIDAHQSTWGLGSSRYFGGEVPKSFFSKFTQIKAG